ncbi:DUF2946 domain-containing protein [Bradyrhizobium sp. ARR65]|uniref:DUF2946 domain-containing protein n=1 Tax=Bradyrhizobium sp. ARR65 TaxID=1040989 RepID=UPI000464CF90|nr:DUF2946 domain-containing protein [Bradyrhizobium sp. ARR65]
MRRRLQKFLPVVLVALAVQILAPIAACWAAALAASDPLPLAEICHGIPGDESGQGDQGGHPAHDGACAICCALQASGSADAPRMFAVWTPYRQATVIVWREAAGFSALRTGSNAQARAPPTLS